MVNKLVSLRHSGPLRFTYMFLYCSSLIFRPRNKQETNRKTNDESVIFHPSKWLETGKNNTPDSAEVSSSAPLPTKPSNLKM
jgi:hypothetical protein